MTDMPLEATDNVPQLARVTDHRAVHGDHEGCAVRLLGDGLGLLGAVGVVDHDVRGRLDRSHRHVDVVVGVPPEQLRRAVDVGKGRRVDAGRCRRAGTRGDRDARVSNRRLSHTQRDRDRQTESEEILLHANHNLS